MKEPRLAAVAGVLAAVGLGLFVYKVAVLGFPLALGSKTDLWTVQARVRFAAEGGPVKVVLQLPDQPPGFTLIDENFVSRGYGFSVRQLEGRREAEWARRRTDGEQTLYYRAVVHASGGDAEPPAPPPVPVPPALGEPYQTALVAVVERVRERSADVPSFTAEILKRLASPAASEDVQLLLGDATTSAARVRLAVQFLEAAGIAARPVHGISLDEDRRRAAERLGLEVYDGASWLFFDPETGQQGRPESFFAWWRGERSLARVRGGHGVRAAISVRHHAADAVKIAERRAELAGSHVVEFSLLGLPIQTQAVYGVLLLVPIGAFLMVLLRNVVGVRTFGTFLPVLVALSFRETRLLWGLVLFTMLLTLGLVARFYLERLRLLLVPRLASVLLVVVLFMVAISVISHRLGLETGLSVALFPMVILTMAIEHMSIQWEERGAAEAIKQGVGTLVVATLAYLVMNVTALQHLVFLFPELLLVLLAATLLLGRYSGYRLLELRRFRAFREDA